MTIENGTAIVLAYVLVSMGVNPAARITPAAGHPGGA
jgi:hypothetical protein